VAVDDEVGAGLGQLVQLGVGLVRRERVDGRLGVGALGVVLDDDLGVDELVGRDAVVAVGVGAGLGLALGPEGDEAAHDLRLGHAAVLCWLRRGRRGLVARLGGVDLAQEVGLAGREPAPVRDAGR